MLKIDCGCSHQLPTVSVLPDFILCFNTDLGFFRQASIFLFGRGKGKCTRSKMFLPVASNTFCTPYLGFEELTRNRTLEMHTRPIHREDHSMLGKGYAYSQC